VSVGRPPLATLSSMRATVKDVAELAAVSPKTVSNVVNGTVFVRDDTRERVERAIAELGYVPNLSARGLRNGRSGVIALAMPDLSTPYSAEMAHAFVEVAHERGWGVQFEETATRPDRAWELLSRARAHLVDGVILNPLTLEQSEPPDGGAVPPLVMIGEVEQSVADQVWVDSVVAARAMTRHLLDLGHRRIAIVGGPGPGFQTDTARLRLQGYHEALAATGVARDPELELSCLTWTPADSAAAVTRFLSAHPPPDAVFCFTDSLAIGALSALHAAGLRVPADVAVAGFDDIADGRFAVPPLTSVAFDKREFAVRTVELLIERMAARRAATTRVTIPFELVLRESTLGRGA